MDTIVAPITPIKKSPIIVFRISGEDALHSLDFIKNKKKIKSRIVNFGLFEDASENLQDYVIYYYFKAPHSYTGEDIVEISFHGNPILAKKALSSFSKKGIRLADPGEFTKRAFLNGKIDLTQAEAIKNIIDASNEFALKTSFLQLDGVLRKKINNIKDRLIDIASTVEAYIDYPEEDFAKDSLGYLKNDLCSLQDAILSLIKGYERYRNIFNNSVNIVIVGKTNVGKSSLFNYLLNEDRSIVSETQGTTRDYIEKDFYLDNFNITLIDTAGFRYCKDEIENEGINKTKKLLNEADLILCIIDLSSNFDLNDNYILDELGKIENNKKILVGNKSDLLERLDYPVDIKISTKTGKNIDELKRRIVKQLYDIDNELDCDVIIQERHFQLLNKIYSIIQNLLQIPIDEALDIFSYEIEGAVNALSEITGETYREEIISNIFENFCVGK
ncbi:MAG: tRNA uridine-5-carboxymethylaminomethyl(34) synthesis GTPase MnmE [Deferribacterota bacterium]|nr:tRNA uridine-5-carboxymethylaminomethyl(34) synthesis GTPase MnmE [Deferribacterota bacterium]